MNPTPLASEKTLRDEFAGQALAGLLASPESRMPFDIVHQLAYNHAEAMLAEKAMRDADHSGDAGRMVDLESANRELLEALQLAVTHVEFFTSAQKGSMAADARTALISKCSSTLAKHKESK